MVTDGADYRLVCFADLCFIFSDDAMLLRLSNPLADGHIKAVQSLHSIQSSCNSGMSSVLMLLWHKLTQSTSSVALDMDSDNIKACGRL